MFNHLNVQREAARVPWEPALVDYRPGWVTRWWARVVTHVLEGYDPWFAKRYQRGHLDGRLPTRTEAT